MTVEPLDLRSRDADHRRAHSNARSLLRFFDCRFDRINRRLDIDDDAFAETRAWRNSKPESRQLPVRQRLADDRANFAGADVQPGEQISHRVTGSSAGLNETFRSPLLCLA